MERRNEDAMKNYRWHPKKIISQIIFHYTTILFKTKPLVSYKGLSSIYIICLCCYLFNSELYSAGRRDYFSGISRLFAQYAFANR
jgi:hypothetical protein